MSKLKVPPVLPFDVIGNIIDILFDDDMSGLQYVKDFSLVCQSFLPLCRKHIFSSVSIKLYGNPFERHRNGEEFAKLLLEKPSIARYIHKLTIYIQQPKFEPNHFLEPLSRQLTRLQSFTIWNSYPFNELIKWNKLSSSTQRSLLNLMHLPTLTHINVTRMSNFPKSNLIISPNVKHLSVQELDIIDDETASPPLCRKSVKLQSLHISIKNSRSPILEAMCPDGRPFLDLSGLEKVSIDMEEADGAVPVIKDVFRKIERLKDVSLRISHHPDFPELEFAETITESLETLRRLKFTITVFEPDPDPLLGICDELQAISGRNKLECLEIDLEVGYEYEAYDEWDRLEEVLIKPGWPELKCVSITIIFVRQYELACELATSLERTEFPRLRTRKHLDFQFSVDMIV